MPAKEAYYSKLNLEDFTDKAYGHVQKLWEVFKIKDMGENHYLYTQCDTLLLADVFVNFRDKCIEIYGLHFAHFSSAPELAWHACLKKTAVNLDLLTDIDMLLIVEEGIRVGICQAIHKYAKASNKYMNNYDKSIESTYLIYLDANNLHGWAMSQILPVNGFKWVEDLSEFSKSFIRNHYEISDRGYFLEVDVEYPKKLFNLHKDLPFSPKRKKL